MGSQAYKFENHPPFDLLFNIDTISDSTVQK